MRGRRVLWPRPFRWRRHRAYDGPPRAARWGTARPLQARTGAASGPAAARAMEHHGTDGAVKLVNGGRYPVTGRAVPDNGLRARQAQVRHEQPAHDLARQVHMSPRTFARWFAAHAGTTPHQWLTSQRLILAQELLERTNHGIEQIAAGCGLAPMMLRRHLTRRWGTPQAYRHRFSQLTG